MVVTVDSGELALRSMDSLTLGGEAQIGGGFDGMETKLAMRGCSETESKEPAATMVTVVVVAATESEAAMWRRQRQQLCGLSRIRLHYAIGENRD